MHERDKRDRKRGRERERERRSNFMEATEK